MKFFYGLFFFSLSKKRKEEEILRKIPYKDNSENSEMRRNEEGKLLNNETLIRVCFKIFQEKIKENHRI